MTAVVGVPAKVVRQGPVGDELPAALERMQRLKEMAQAEQLNEPGA